MERCLKYDQNKFRMDPGTRSEASEMLVALIDALKTASTGDDAAYHQAKFFSNLVMLEDWIRSRNPTRMPSPFAGGTTEVDRMQINAINADLRPTGDHDFSEYLELDRLVCRWC